jgi:hypothetical protein
MALRPNPEALAQSKLSTMPEQAHVTERLHSLRAEQAALLAAGAAQLDSVRWHYFEVLAQRAEQQTGAAQALLCNKLEQVLETLQQQGATKTESQDKRVEAAPSPLADLLKGMSPQQPNDPLNPPGEWRRESPRVQQFRQQLGRLSVQKKISQAIAQAPQNAGPINSHMLVLRSLGIMRDVSPDYLNRFMAYVDTLMCLDQAVPGKAKAKTKAQG